MYRRYLVLMIFLLPLFAIQGLAQETTGSISGVIYNEEGGSLPFATVTATDQATNATYSVYTQDDGAFQLHNLTPSLYIIEVMYVGYRTMSSTPLPVKLGQEAVYNTTMVPDSQELDEITISTSRVVKDGAGYAVNEDLIDDVPVIVRSIQELSRINPQNNLNSFGGASHRFNNLNIDGVATNDIIGFQEPASGAAGSQASGTPGSLSKSQPIGFGAIKELSIKLTPFDVSVGNFNGANIDIVTKNGTNKFEHSVFGFGNNQATLGRRIDGNEITRTDFSDYQIGFNSGGPIIKDKLFYFANVEFAKSVTPLANAPGSAESEISLEDANRVRDHLLENYNYDPGAFQEASNTIQSTKVFGRLDYIINKYHRLTFRSNYVSGFADNLEWSGNIFNFGNQGFRHNSRASSTLVELKSNFSQFFNKLNISFNSVTEGRTFEGDLFPHIQIATSAASRVFAGTYREASVFNTSFQTLQITDKLSFVMEDHSISGGFLLQLNDVDYGFLSAWNGRWEYSSLDNFLNDRPSRVRGVYNVDPANNNFDFVQNNPAGTFGVLEGGVYLQDKWSISNNLKVAYGVRLDMQYLTEALPISPLISNSESFNRFNNELSNNLQWNPRASIDYKFGDSGWSVTAGTGLFSGKLPYLWFGYFDYISGTDYFNIDIRPGGEEVPLTELSDLTEVQPGLTEVNLLDPDFKFPRDWKTNVGIEWQQGDNWKFGAEFSYTNVLQGLFFQTINRTENLANFRGADDRLFYNTSGEEVKIDQSFTNVFVLTNTDQGYRYNATLTAERKAGNAYSYFGYTYGVSKDISSTVRSSPAANYEWNQALFGNDPELSFSNHDLRHKINFLQAYNFGFGNHSLEVSLLYNGRSGSPFTFVYQGDLNRDGSSRNDLIYVPANESEINLVDFTDINGNLVTAEEQWQSLDAYISSVDYLDENRGDHTVRNGGRTPWNHSVDMSFKFNLSTKNADRVSFKVDVFNILNVINSSWGKQYFVPNVVNSSFSLLGFEGINDFQPEFTFDIPLETRPWIVDTFNSRWRLQLGFEYAF